MVILHTAVATQVLGAPICRPRSPKGDPRGTPAYLLPHCCHSSRFKTSHTLEFALRLAISVTRRETRIEAVRDDTGATDVSHTAQDAQPTRTRDVMISWRIAGRCCTTISRRRATTRRRRWRWGTATCTAWGCRAAARPLCCTTTPWLSSWWSGLATPSRSPRCDFVCSPLGPRRGSSPCGVCHVWGLACALWLLWVTHASCSGFHAISL